MIVKKLNGFSGSQIYLMKENNLLFIRKIGNVERNYIQLNKLQEYNIDCPIIYNKDGDILDMEYIPSLDMKSFLIYNSHLPLVNFLITSLDTFKQNITDIKDYTEIYNQKLNEIDFSLLPFDKNQLIDRLPKKIPQTKIFHGDMTLENILYNNTYSKFYFIDAVDIEYDSYVFDIAKLRQDLTCGWFLRNTKNHFLNVKLSDIQKRILNKFSEADNNYILILMLLRVYKHASKDSQEHKFLLSELTRLWK